MVSTSWLTKQRKSALIDLAAQAGLELDDGLNKPEVVDALDDFLQTNSSRLQNDPTFEPFFVTRRTPHKARDNSDEAEVKSVVRGRGRRATKVKSEPEDSDEYVGAATRTSVMASSPTAVQRRTPAASIMQRRRSSLPPSPTIVVDEVEHANTRFWAGFDDIITVSGVPEMIDWLRESCSSLAAVHATSILAEAYQLQRALVPWKFAFDIPAIHTIGTPSIAVKVPDLFQLLSPYFWLPTLLWAATNLFIPLLFAYFYNLTVHTVKRNNARVRVVRYNYDPFTFNVAKVLLVSTVYGAGMLHGYVSDKTVAVVDASQYGGYKGILTGCYVCGLYSLWAATQR
ncbi:hypothetical protein Q7P37_011268 [Cladosporium fusiforme]